MKKIVALALVLMLALPFAAMAETVTGEADGFGGKVTVTLTVEDGKIVEATATGDGETPTVGGAALEPLAAQLVEAGSADIEGVTGATFTSNAVKAAAEAALAGGAGEASDEAIAFTAGEYTAVADGYNGPVTVKVTYTDSAIEAIEVTESAETVHVGTVAFDIMIPEMLEVNGSGVDGVAGATFSTRALRTAVNDTAEQAGCTNLDAFKAAKVEHVAGDPIELEYDVVVVGAGGAGMAAAAQATQNGNTVLVIEKNAEVGGNTWCPAASISP